MIEFIKGTIDTLNPAFVVVETATGVGYLLNISLTTYSKLENNTDSPCKILVHEVIREDAITLYGFASENERNMFRALISVSGVGASTARVVLSTLKPDELSMVIASGDVARLKAVKGVGAKTAQRIIVDLRDKINAPDDTLLQQPVNNADVFDEALAALSILGFAPATSRKALKKIFDNNPATKVEDAIRQALAMM